MLLPRSVTNQKQFRDIQSAVVDFHSFVFPSPHTLAPTAPETLSNQTLFHNYPEILRGNITAVANKCQREISRHTGELERLGVKKY